MTIVWGACWPQPCMVWPLALGATQGSCGLCGQREFAPTSTPKDGRAHRVRKSV